MIPSADSAGAPSLGTPVENRAAIMLANSTVMSDASNSPKDPPPRARTGADAALPPLDFTTFVLSLSTSALTHLGESHGPDAHTHVDLMLARQTIDLITLLQQKTRGNLTGEEERLLEQVLFDLRMRFVDVSGRPQAR